MSKRKKINTIFGILILCGLCFGCQKKTELGDFSGKYKIVSMSKKPFSYMLGQYESVNELKVDDEIELQVVNEKIFVSHNGKQIEEKRTFKKSKHELRCYKLGSDIFAPHYEREFDRFSKISDEFYMIESKRFAVGLHLFFIPYFDRKKSKITLIRYDVVSK